MIEKLCQWLCRRYTKPDDQSKNERRYLQIRQDEMEIRLRAVLLELDALVPQQSPPGKIGEY